MSRTQKIAKHRKGEGSLFLKNGIWYVKLCRKGFAPIKRSTHCKEKDVAGAEAFRKEFVRPFQAKSEAEMYENISTRIKIKQSEAIVKDKPIEIRYLVDCYTASIKPKVLAENTENSYGSVINVFAKWMKAHRRKSFAWQVKKEDVKEFMRFIGEKNGVMTYNLYVKVLRLLYKTAMESDNNIKANPIDDIKMLKSEASIRRPFSDVEIQNIDAVLSTEPEEVQLFFKLLEYTGLRSSDCSTLRLDEVDVKSGNIRRLPIKTHGSGMYAVIPIEPSLIPVLTKRLMTISDSEYLMPKMAELYHAKRLWCCIGKVLKKANVTTSIKDKNGKTRIVTGGHAYRHRFASLALDAGNTIPQLQSMLAHSAAYMSLKYAHVTQTPVLPNFKRSAMPPLLGTEAESVIEQLKGLCQQGESVGDCLNRLLGNQKMIAQMPDVRTMFLENANGQKLLEYKPETTSQQQGGEA